MASAEFPLVENRRLDFRIAAKLLNHFGLDLDLDLACTTQTPDKALAGDVIECLQELFTISGLCVNTQDGFGSGFCRRSDEQ